jgi:hypothetical protein
MGTWETSQFVSASAISEVPYGEVAVLNTRPPVRNWTTYHPVAIRSQVATPNSHCKSDLTLRSMNFHPVKTRSGRTSKWLPVLQMRALPSYTYIDAKLIELKWLNYKDRNCFSV